MVGTLLDPPCFTQVCLVEQRRSAPQPPLGGALSLEMPTIRANARVGLQSADWCGMRQGFAVGIWALGLSELWSGKEVDK